MWTSIILFVLGFIKEILADVIKEHISKPDYTIKGTYSGKVSGDVYNPDLYFTKFERLLKEDNTR